MLPIALYLCFLLWLVYLIGGTLLYLCLILYNSITCRYASCSVHHKLLEVYVGSGHAPRVTCQHLVITTASSADTPVLHVYLLDVCCIIMAEQWPRSTPVIVIMFLAGQSMEPQAWFMMLSLNWGVTPIYYVCLLKYLHVWQTWTSKSSFPTLATCIAHRAARAPCQHSCTALLTFLHCLANIIAPTWCAYWLPHVLLQLSWSTCLMCDLATHLHIRQSVQPHAHVYKSTELSYLCCYLLSSVASIVCHATDLSRIPMLLVYIPS